MSNLYKILTTLSESILKRRQRELVSRVRISELSEAIRVDLGSPTQIGHFSRVVTTALLSSSADNAIVGNRLIYEASRLKPDQFDYIGIITNWLLTRDPRITEWVTATHVAFGTINDMLRENPHVDTKFGQLQRCICDFMTNIEVTHVAMISAKDVAVTLLNNFFDQLVEPKEFLERCDLLPGAEVRTRVAIDV